MMAGTVYVQATWTPYSLNHTLWCSGKALSPFLGPTYTTKASCSHTKCSPSALSELALCCIPLGMYPGREWPLPGESLPFPGQERPHLLPEMSCLTPTKVYQASGI